MSKALIRRRRSKNYFLMPNRSNKYHSSSKMIINKKVVPILTPITNLATPKMLKDARVKEVGDKKQ